MTRSVATANAVAETETEMDTKGIDEALRKTLQDRKLSRSERKALGGVLSELQPDERERDLLRSRAFEIAREELATPRGKEVFDWLEDVVKVLDRPWDAAAAGDGGDKAAELAEVHFSPGTSCLDRLNQLIRSVGRSIDIAVFTITDNRITRTLLDAHRRGVKVRLVTDDDKREDRGSDVDELARAGVDVVLDNSRFHMHHKFAVFDGKVVVTGSFNWTRQATDANQENLVVTDDRQLVAAFRAEFDRLWNEFGAGAA